MKKIVAIALMAVTLTACGSLEEKYTELTAKDFDIICLNGVEYYYRRALSSNAGFMAVKFNTDSTVSTCGG